MVGVQESPLESVCIAPVGEEVPNVRAMPHECFKPPSKIFTTNKPCRKQKQYLPVCIRICEYFFTDLHAQAVWQALSSEVVHAFFSQILTNKKKTTIKNSERAWEDSVQRKMHHLFLRTKSREGLLQTCRRGLVLVAFLLPTRLLCFCPLFLHVSSEERVVVRPLLSCCHVWRTLYASPSHFVFM